MELVQGRPASCAGRLEKEVRVYEFLDSLGIAYRSEERRCRERV